MNIDIGSSKRATDKSGPLDSGRMFGIARQLSAQTFYIVLGNIFTLAIGLPLQIYVARVIGPAGLGTYSLIDGALFTASGLVGFGVAQTTLRFVPAHLENCEYAAVRRLLRTGAIILMSVGGVSYAAVLIALPYVGAWWPAVEADKQTIAIMAISLPLGLLVHFLQQGLRGFQEIRYLTLGSSIVQLTIKAITTVVAFAVGFRLDGYAVATVLSIFVAMLWLGRGIQKKISELPPGPLGRRDSKVDASYLRQWRQYASVCYFQGVLGVATARLDVFIIGAYVDRNAVGVFAAVLQLQQLPQVFLTMLLSIGAPMLVSAQAREAAAERDHIYALMTDWAVKASLPLILFLMLFAPNVLALFGPEFSERGADILRGLLLMQASALAFGPVGTIAMMCGLERTFVRYSVFQTALSASLTISLVIPLGLVGVVIARFATTVITNTLVIAAVRRKLHFRWWNRRFLSWLLPAVASMGIGAAVLYGGVVLNAVSLAGALFAMYGAFALAMLAQGLHEDERDLLRSVTAWVMSWKTSRA